MCGFVGYVGGNGDALPRMMATIRHRGPDAEGVWSDPHTAVYLGHCRLSILDIEGGAQPMATADDRFLIVFNGEIYNHASLRNELEARGHRFRTDHSDTETLLVGYREWGSDLFHRLNGMWALVIYDRQAQRLILSRDRFGQKPLFYTLTPEGMIFGSELSAIRVHPRAPHEMSRSSLQKYFAYGYIPEPHTLYEKIHKFPRGSWGSYDLTDRVLRIERYWRYILEPAPMPKDPLATYGEPLRELLAEAVRDHLVADVPVGIFLSGGIDSTTVAWMAKRVCEPQLFSIGFEEPSFDETPYIQFASEWIGATLHLQQFSVEDARLLIPEILGRLDEPMGDSSLLPTYCLCQYTRKHVKVALGGDGGDELFAGYDPFRALRLARICARVLPRPAIELLYRLAGYLPTLHTNMNFPFKIRRSLRGLRYDRVFWNPVWLGPLAPDSLSALFGENTHLEALYDEALTSWRACPQEDLVAKTLQFYTDLYLADDILVKSDRASMMHGLEVRSPFLDPRIADFARRLPLEVKFSNGGTTKWILKKAMEPLLPREILYRPKKGFGVPIGKWLAAGDLAPQFLPELNSLGIRIAYARTLWEEHRHGKEDHRAFLWNLIVLEHHLATQG